MSLACLSIIKCRQTTYLVVAGNQNFLMIFRRESLKEYTRLDNIEVPNNNVGYMKVVENMMYLSNFNGEISQFDISEFPKLKLLKRSKSKFASLYDKSFDILNFTVYCSLSNSPSKKVLSSEDLRKFKNYYFTKHTDQIYCVKIGKYIKKIFSGSYDRSIAVYNQFSRKLYVLKKSYHKGWIAVIELICKDRFMISSGFDNQVCIFDLKTNHLDITIDLEYNIYMTDWFSEFNCLFLAGTRKTSICIVKKNQTELIKKKNMSCLPFF